MQNQVNIVFLILASVFFALLMVAFVTIFLYVTQKRSFKYNENISVIRKEYETAVLNSQIEVQANTLQQLSDEIHDNIGQKLSFTKMSLNGLTQNIPPDKLPLLEETNLVLSEIISELRHISKSISPRHIEDFGLAEAISYQVEWVNKAEEITAELNMSGDKKSFNPRVELVVFRMVQELMNNAVKHSECKSILVSMLYENEKITIRIKDDGKGFDMNTIEQNANFRNGTGLHSIENKAKTINCSIAFSSNKNGTMVTLTKNFQNDSY
jgi:signal transduction histidine kinase